MSHQPERLERNCLNCGAQVHGRYCHKCGQENIVIKQGFWPMTKHFVYDVLHFDGKFFHTLLYIFTKPGFVAKQYVEGKRVSYLDPIRMYLFTSAIFFLIFFALNPVNITQSVETGDLDYKDRQELIDEYKQRIEQSPADSFLRERIALLKDTTKPINIDTLGWRSQGQLFSFTEKRYKSVAEYDSIQNTLPDETKDGWFAKKMIRQSIKLNKKYGYNKEGAKAFLQSFLHKLPYLLFLSLPFFAFILKLLYVRRKHLYYSDHAVFTLYHYIFSFILLLLVFFFSGIKTWTGWSIFSFLTILLYVSWPVYLFLQMKTFYGQGWGKTLIKFILLNIVGIVILLVLFILFFFFSIFQA